MIVTYLGSTITTHTLSYVHIESTYRRYFKNENIR